ncbi:MAG: hypothetical protein GXO79_06565 [Chlorobi bacterium]|nr:hypothetical protein [Chlorobiota bacterium]
MAIFGAGSNWSGKEIRQELFNNDNYLIGWDVANAEDLYTLISSIKVGDIIYLKSNRPGSLNIRIKGIGIVTRSLMQLLFEKRTNLEKSRTGFELPVKWLDKVEFKISIPNDTGKLTNIRAATLYEEYLPFVQNEILKRLFAKL